MVNNKKILMVIMASLSLLPVMKCAAAVDIDTDYLDVYNNYTEPSQVLIIQPLEEKCANEGKVYVSTRLDPDVATRLYWGVKRDEAATADRDSLCEHERWRTFKVSLGSDSADMKCVDKGYVRHASEAQLSCTLSSNPNIHMVPKYEYPADHRLLRLDFPK